MCFEMIQYNDYTWSWILKAGNHREIACSGGTFRHKQSCMRSIKRIKLNSLSKVPVHEHKSKRTQLL